MSNPPFAITPKILNLVSNITEVVTKLEILEFNIDLKLRKSSKIKTITGTLQIEGNSYPFIEYMLESILIICEETLQNVPKNVPKKRMQEIIESIKNNKFITIEELANNLNVSAKTIKRDLDKLKKDNILQRVGKKGGYWKILS